MLNLNNLYNNTELFNVLRANKLSRNACMVIYTQHPLGEILADYWVKMGFLTLPKIKFETYGKVLDKPMANQVKRSGLVRSVKTSLSYSNVFGEAALYSVQEYLDTDDIRNNVSTPITLKDTKDAIRFEFKSVDPLMEQGSTNLDPLNISYMQTEKVYIGGVEYSPSRYRVVKRGIPLYLSYTNEAFKFTGRSVYHNCFPTLLGYATLIIALLRMGEQASSMVFKLSETSRGKALDKATTATVEALKQRIEKFNESDNFDILPIFNDEDIGYLTSGQHFEGYKEILNALVSSISTSTQVDKKYLLGETYASVMSEGSNDLDLLKFNIQGYREEVIEPLLEWGASLLIPRLCKTDLIKQLIEEYPEDFNGKSDSEIYGMIADDFVIEWGVFKEENASEMALLDAQIVENIKNILSFYGNTPENIEWAIKTLNEKTNICKANNLAIDINKPEEVI